MATVYEIVTSEIIRKLDEGTVPWRQPWIGTQAQNWQSRRPYRGINALLLPPGEYATFNQIKAAGGTIKEGEHGNIVIFWKMGDKPVSADGDEASNKTGAPMIRYYKVWEINTQVEGLESKRKEQPKDNDPIQSAESIVAGYKGKPEITTADDRAYYRPASDIINVPAIKLFRSPEEYYSTLFHEMGHSTGHKSRLARPNLMSTAACGSETYSQEELVAEITAAYLCGSAGILPSVIDNSAAYIASWRKFLQNNSKAIVQAASQAQKAADYILGAEIAKA